MEKGSKSPSLLNQKQEIWKEMENKLMYEIKELIKILKSGNEGKKETTVKKV